MTYDNWKTTNPDDEFLGLPPCEEAWERFHNGELSLDEMGEYLIRAHFSPQQVRKMLSTEYPIPKGYFGRE